MKAERTAAAEAARGAAEQRRADNRRQVQEAVRAITLKSLELPFREREDWLAGLFRELEDGDGYDGDPADTIADLCVRLGTPLKDLPDLMAEQCTDRAALAAIGQAYIAMRQAEAPGGGGDGKNGGSSNGGRAASDDPMASFAAAKAQGPPN